jgi:filamentous hemagglutinin family protein
VALPPKVSLALVSACLLAAVVPRVAAAQQITVDGRFSPAQTLFGPNYAITANLGKQVGSNLFHSFGQFGLSTGESAAFNGPATINNIIGRVTGGNSSSIDGKIQSNIAGANLYLINPSGIVFGPNATVNVSGSFHASTADYLKMSDGAKFQATNPDASTLSAAPPAAFGFLTARPAAITVNGSTLGPVPGTLGVVAGPISITGATLSAPAGTIHVTSAAGTGEVPVDPRNTPGLTVTSFGQVDIKGSSTLDVSDPKNLGSGGSVFIRSGALTIDASEINADNYGSGPGGQLALQADSQITLSSTANVHALAQASGTGGDIVIRTSPGGGISVANSIVAVGSLAAGDSGQLSVATGQLSLTNGAALRSDAQGSGSGGPITISAGSVVLDGGVALDSSTGIFSTTSDIATGGSITIVAGQLALHNGANVLASSCATAACSPDSASPATTGAGPGGGVAVSVGGAVTVDSGASLGTAAFAAGNAGDVSVTAAGPVTIDMSVGVDHSLFQGIASQTTGTGSAGNVTVTAGTLSIVNNGEIFSATAGSGNAGDVSVTAFDKLTIDGSGGAPGVSPTGIFSEAVAGSGAAGTLSVTAGTLSIVNNGEISSSTFASGNAGNLTVAVSGQLMIDGSGGNPEARAATGIFSLAVGSGAAGAVSVSAGTLSIANSGEIAASTFASGNAGSLSVAVSGQLTMDGSGEDLALGRTGIFSQADLGSSGAAGSVSVSAATLVVGNDGVISSGTLGLGNGGSVSVTAGNLAIVSDGRIATDARGTDSGNAGDVSVNVAGRVEIDGVSQTSFTGISSRSTQGSNGNAGEVMVSTGILSIANGGSISTEAEGERSTASGGNITLHLRDFLYLVSSEISTSVKGETGNGGNITIDPQFVILNHSSIIAQAIKGHGGNITITAGQFVPSSDSIISATSELGISGTVVINGPLVDVNGALVVLSSQLRGRTEVLREACAARADRPISSLIEAGRGGLPQDPEATLPALYIANRDVYPGWQAGAGTSAASSSLQTMARLTMRCGLADDERRE